MKTKKGATIMKKITLSLVLTALLATSVAAQYDPTKLYYNSGNFGLGTDTPSSFLNLKEKNATLTLQSTSAGQTIDNDGANNGWPGIMVQSPLVKNGSPVNRWNVFYSARDKYLAFFDYANYRIAQAFYDGGGTLFNTGMSWFQVGGSTGYHNYLIRGENKINAGATDTSIKIMGSLAGSQSYVPPAVVGAKFVEVGGVHHNSMVNPQDFNAGSMALVVETVGGGARYGSAWVFKTTADSYGNNGVGGEATEKVRISKDGRLGIGTSTPYAMLHIKAGALPLASFESSAAVSSAIELKDGATTQNKWWLSLGVTSATDGKLCVYDARQNGIRMVWDTNGNVGIGTNTPSTKLEVVGTIKTSDLIFTATGWADYVFEPHYDLMPLNELETFIKSKKHLPEVPSEAEVKKNGASVAKMNVALLRKVEELTLYVINLKKENDSLKSQLKSLDVRLSKLENK